uniref:Replication associated protein n=1 Tax=Eastern chimpanzee porprismacovirus 6 TaxID=2762499 RepID=A0A7G7XYJ1_9VIRU|nr:replication associated protein [Eastern chimpanzee porprismacovirus 6]
MGNKNYMLTMKANGTNKFLITKFILDNDLHKWIVGKECGRNGYKHYQVRLRCPHEWEELRNFFGGEAHIEECSDTWDYEAKGGKYLSSEDWGLRRKQRFMPLRQVQNEALVCLESTNDREVMVWYDQEGNKGKSWLSNHLWETGQAYVVDSDKAETIKKDIASEYIEHGWRPIVIIDLPRTAKWTPDLYYAIERIKDGLLKDPRYNSKTVNIHGVKVMVMCNTPPKLDKLSADRWKMFGGDVSPQAPLHDGTSGASRFS